MRDKVKTLISANKPIWDVSWLGNLTDEKRIIFFINENLYSDNVTTLFNLKKKHVVDLALFYDLFVKDFGYQVFNDHNGFGIYDQLNLHPQIKLQEIVNRMAYNIGTTVMSDNQVFKPLGVNMNSRKARFDVAFFEGLEGSISGYYRDGSKSEIEEFMIDEIEGIDLAIDYFLNAIGKRTDPIEHLDSLTELKYYTAVLKMQSTFRNKQSRNKSRKFIKNFVSGMQSLKEGRNSEFLNNPYSMKDIFYDSMYRIYTEQFLYLSAKGENIDSRSVYEQRKPKTDSNV